MRWTLFFLWINFTLFGTVTPGIEQLLTPEHVSLIAGKRIALFTNQAAVTRDLKSSAKLLKEQEHIHGYKLVAYFAPEHGIDGSKHAGEQVAHTTYLNLPVYSLHGKSKRPTKEQLQGIDTIIVDIQDLGSRSYTYLTTTCYLLEEAGKQGKTVIVADRPNPINGLVSDGALVDSFQRSFLSYLNVPYCHGMTIGELAKLHNDSLSPPCRLRVIPMKGWKRSHTFAETGLHWIPTSPNIPEPSSALYYPMTGILGELQIVNIGVGYTLPFRTVAAPWIDGEKLAAKLNAQKLPGIHFQPLHYKPFHGKFAKQDIHGVLLVVTDAKILQPVTVGYTLMGLLKSLYPKEFAASVKMKENRRATFDRVNGTDEVLKTLETEPYPSWKLRAIASKGAKTFAAKRKKFLLQEYKN